MRTLTTYARTPFDDRNISLNELTAFTMDNLDRMSANNPNGTDLTPRIAATTIAFGNLDATFSADLAASGVRKSQVQTKDNYRKDAIREAEGIVSLVIGEVGSESPMVAQFVPQGRSVFSKAVDGELDNHFDRLVTAATANQGALGALGAIILQRATDLRDGWATIYEATRTAKGEKTATIDEKNAARTALQWELYMNLQTITQLFPRDEGKIELYMRQALLGFPVPLGGGGGGGGGSDSSDGSESTESTESSEDGPVSSDSEPPFSTSSEFLSSSSDFESHSSEFPSSSSEMIPSSSSEMIPSSSSDFLSSSSSGV